MLSTRQRLYEIARLRVKLLETRIDFLRDKFAPLLGAAINQHKIVLPIELRDYAENLYLQRVAGQRIDDAGRRNLQQQAMGETLFDAIAERDPDFHKKNTQWMLNVILSGGSLVEDLEKATYYLTIFERVKRMLPVEARDLNIKRYPSFADLYAAIEDKEREMSKREADRKQDVAMHGEATVIMDTSKYKIVIPNTEAASCHFGINTQWCTTAAYSHNQFNRYNSEGPLYIILDKEKNRRYQYHFPSGQFVNERDQRIDIAKFREVYPEVFQVLSAQLPKPVGSLDNMPVYRMPNGNFYFRRTPYIDASEMVGTIRLKDGKLYNIDGPNVSQQEVANLLNHLGVQGDQEGGESAGLYYRPIGGDLGFEDLRWQTIAEASKPVLKFPDGWMWRGLKTNMGIDLILTAPDVDEPEKGSALQQFQALHPKATNGYMDKAGYALKAYIGSDGIFTVTNTPIFPAIPQWENNFKRRKQMMGDLLGKYIVDLLLTMNGIKGWEKNREFRPSYLDQTQAKRLVDAKPELADLITVYNAQGVTPATKRMVIKELNRHEIDYVDAPKGRWFDKDKLVVVQWNNIEDAIDELATEQGERFFEHYISDNSNIEIYDHPGLEYYRDDLLTELQKQKPDLYKRLVLYLQSEYAETIEDEFDDEFDPTSTSDVDKLLQSVDDSIVDGAMSNAVISGLETGAQSQAHKVFKNEIDKHEYLFFQHKYAPHRPGQPVRELKKPQWSGEFQWDAPVMLAIPMEKLVDLLTYPDDLASEGWISSLGDNYKLDFQEPHYGFDEYDDDYAAERFIENLDDELPEVKAKPKRRRRSR